jgi:hypothetical protein
VSSTFDYLEYTIECELKVLTINPQNAEFQRRAGKRDRRRGIETDSGTVLELVVNGMRMRYSTIGVSGKTPYLDIPPFFTYCRLSFFLVQQIGG